MDNWFTKKRTPKESTRNVAILLALLFILTYLMYLVNTQLDNIAAENQQQLAAVTETAAPTEGSN